ncbi:phospholipid carrier-dependent glycosyltransferase [Coleofasciculus sp. FACHB-1120]|uniref:glycosyltransferase family 39 protein n=1 Tax=Coleofasciculus sp. FACHB-1120 TaxID=2692783 RepID=UPI001687BD1C|nr:phospholipid carrier-dependent glycosyltransferase [Coleofasciculus sp. FACHB-1120]MBD2742808.1 phospholipid carrier-dependent glycosyltransferase [Coleofasciculus sp. FACHB-1120]
MINNWLLLLVWIGVGTGLRLLNLAGKSPWTDEFSTLVFSLGNSFRGVPLDQAIALDTLLQPLQPNPAAGIQDVIHHLVTESNHPPLYFVLTHLWLKLFPPDGGLVSLWGARSLAALFGVVSIPAMYAFGWFAFRSRLVGHMAAAMMAVSPYAIFLAQEARHYTLAILWVIASLTCLLVAARHLQRQAPLPIWLVLLWVSINTLGISSHYFFVLTLGAQGLALIVLLWQQRRTQNNFKFPTIKSLLSLLPVAAGTLAGGLVWVPVFLQNSYGGKLTEWIQGDRVGLAWLSPIFQAIAAWITMIALLPVESPDLIVVILCGPVMLIFFLWSLPILYRGLKFQRQEAGLTTQLFEGFVWSAIALFFVFTYFLGIDLTRGARYNFVYFPAVIVILGASLAVCWNAVRAEETTLKESVLASNNPGSKAKIQDAKLFLQTSGKKVVVIIFLMGLLSGLTVACNLGYQKYYRPDLLVSPILYPLDYLSTSELVPVLIATTHKTHVQTGEMMGIAWELKQEEEQTRRTQFLLAHQDQNPQTSTVALQKTLATLPRPLDVLLLNFHAPIEPIELNKCVADADFPSVDGYEAKLYHCPYR